MVRELVRDAGLLGDLVAEEERGGAAQGHRQQDNVWQQARVGPATDAVADYCSRAHSRTTSRFDVSSRPARSRRQGSAD